MSRPMIPYPEKYWASMAALSSLQSIPGYNFVQPCYYYDGYHYINGRAYLIHPDKNLLIRKETETVLARSEVSISVFIRWNKERKRNSSSENLVSVSCFIIVNILKKEAQKSQDQNLAQIVHHSFKDQLFETTRVKRILFQEAQSKLQIENLNILLNKEINEQRTRINRLEKEKADLFLLNLQLLGKLTTNNTNKE